MDFNLNQIVERLYNEKNDRESTLRTTRTLGEKAAEGVLSTISYSKIVKLANIDQLDAASARNLLVACCPEYESKIEDFADRVLCDLLEQSGGAAANELKGVWKMSFIETMKNYVPMILEEIERHK